MGFPIFMFAITLLIPLCMIIIGANFSKKAPKKVNYLFGYRTRMSMLNKDTWDFANHYIGKIWLRLGSVILILSIIIMLFLFKAEPYIFVKWAIIIIIIQAVFMIIPNIITERALRKNFTPDGIRRKGEKDV